MSADCTNYPDRIWLREDRGGIPSDEEGPWIEAAPGCGAEYARRRPDDPDLAREVLSLRADNARLQAETLETPARALREAVRAFFDAEADVDECPPYDPEEWPGATSERSRRFDALKEARDRLAALAARPEPEESAPDWHDYCAECGDLMPNQNSSWCDACRFDGPWDEHGEPPPEPEEPAHDR